MMTSRTASRVSVILDLESGPLYRKYSGNGGPVSVQIDDGRTLQEDKEGNRFLVETHPAMVTITADTKTYEIPLDRIGEIGYEGNGKEHLIEP